MNLGKWLHEPLVHFLLAGAALYIGASFLAPGPSEERTIVVDHDALIADLQQRSQATDRATLEQALRTMPAPERARLVHDTALQEALYREGQLLGLNTVDPLVRLRTIQQMRLLLTDEAAANMAVSDAEVAKYYAANKADYADPAEASFGHLYFAGPDGEARARAALAQLQGGKATPDQFGDRFLYQSNYAETAADEIAAEFGRGFAEALFKLRPGEPWQGPVRSDHGWHLVQLRSIEMPRVPPLAEVKNRVRDDALAAKRTTALDKAMNALLEKYEVRVR